MMKTYGVPCLAVLSIISLTASTGWGSLSFSSVDVSLGGLSNNDSFIQFDVVNSPYSQSQGDTQNDLGGTSSVHNAQLAAVTSADAAGLSPQARATAYTGWGSVVSHAYADMSGGAPSRAYAMAVQDWLLSVTGAGNGTFAAPYTITWDLRSSVGETASGNSYWGLLLYDDSSSLVASAWESFSLPVSNGASSLSSYADTLTLNYDFSSPGTYDLRLYTDAEATVVPVPGATLLGSLGLGVAGWLVRRQGRSIPA
jgi:hypothetical protein